jgi:hypothetical protein
MTTTIGTVHTIFGIDSIEATVTAMAGDFAADFDMEAAADGYRDYLTDYLPGTLVVLGDDVMMQTDDPFATRLGHAGIEQIRENIADDMAGDDAFDLTPYAKPGRAQCGAAGRNANSRTCGTERPESAEQNTPATLGDDLRRVAELADTGLLDGTYIQFSFHTQDAARVQAVNDRLGGRVRRYRSSTGTVQAHNDGALVGSVSVIGVINTGALWGDDGGSDEVWAEIVRNGGTS